MNSPGLDHYAECGYKTRLCAHAFVGPELAPRSFTTGRLAIHDGEWPHAAEDDAFMSGVRPSFLG